MSGVFPSAAALQFYCAAPHARSYLPAQVPAPAHLIGRGVYSQLASPGFRRSGLFVYRP
ncbi:MAG: hypothetical protein LBD68_01195 [Zoogloeaceae bacterium]|nr:hypothetical protein [Zoogloeaceae bacterium]